MEQVGPWVCAAVGAAIAGQKLWEVANQKIAETAWAAMYVKPTPCKRILEAPPGSLPTQQQVQEMLAGERYSFWLGLPEGQPPPRPRTVLPAVDVQQARFVRSFLFLYEETLDITELMSGFRVALQNFPQVGGVLRNRFSTQDDRSREGVEEIWVEHESPRVEFVLVRYDADTMPQELKEGDVGTASWKDSNWASMSSPITCGTPLALGTPLARIQVSYFADPTPGTAVRTAVSLFLSHGIGDANSAFAFARHWSSATRALKEGRGLDNASLGVPEPNHDKSPLYPSLPIPHVTAQRALEVGWRKACSIAVVWRFTRYSWLYAEPRHEVDFYQRRFSVEEVELLKQHVRAAAGPALEGRLLSTNDVITALFWKWRSTYEEWPKAVDSGKRRMVVICNTRRALGLGSSYYGNSITFLQKELDTEAVRNMSLADLALVIRDMVDAFGPEDARDVQNFLNRNFHHGGSRSLVSYEPPMDYPSSMLVSNWSKFNVYDVDFGWGRPVRFVYPLWIAVPGTHVVNTVVTSSGETFSEWTYASTAAMHEEVSKITVADIIKAEEARA